MIKGIKKKIDNPNMQHKNLKLAKKTIPLTFQEVNKQGMQKIVPELHFKMNVQPE